MKRSGLKTGMIVEKRNGELGFVLLGTSNGDIIASDNGNKFGDWCPIEANYDEGLMYRDDDDRHNDIVKIYDGGTNKDYLTMESKLLVWERKEPIEITLDEIAKKFGVDVKQLKIKK